MENHNNRTLILKKGMYGKGPVAYWMSRDQRAENNWALLEAQREALLTGKSLFVLFCLADSFLNATARAYDFMLRGLAETQKDLAERNIPLIILRGAPEREIPRSCMDLSVSSLYLDFDPLKEKRQWQENVSHRLNINIYLTDTHNIVPCWEASQKQEYAARTFRPRINNKIPLYLVPFPPLVKHPFNQSSEISFLDPNALLKDIAPDPSVSPVQWLKPGGSAGMKRLDKFIREKLSYYDKDRNDPNLDVLSHLSPYLHFGQISAQECALKLQAYGKPEETETFLEEFIIRRELADNYCYYNHFYDSFEGFPDWAKRTHEKHRKDKRKYIYSINDLEYAQSHDPLWNAAQRDMIKNGKMHGWLRMYWAKKILEWTISPEKALEISQYLNDKYELDGRDPNGYTGISWSMGGVHDSGWPERAIFGKIRYMNYNGAKRKFDVKEYERSIPDL